MAIKGNGQDYDATFSAGSTVKTTTAQYLVVGMEATATSADHTAYMANAGAALSSTITARSAIGIVQSYPSASSEAVTTRLLGISKAKCAASIPAGAFVSAYEGASTTTFAGYINEETFGTVLTSSAHRVVLGRALESGSTGTTISVMLNPSVVRIA